MANRENWTELEGIVSLQRWQELQRAGPLECISLTKAPPLGTRAARNLSQVETARLWLWCRVTGPALRELLANPLLETVDILGLGPGRLSGFWSAPRLHTLRVPGYDLTTRDLNEIARCKTLEALAIQNVTLSMATAEAILCLPALRSLDLEASNFDDRHSCALSSSTQLDSLDLGATRITRSALRRIATIHSLRSLDLWATAISEKDLEELEALPNLEYLSLGSSSPSDGYDADRLLPRLFALRGLKQLWLDGVVVTPSQRAQLEDRVEKVRIDAP